ncbi:MAG TPA: DUF4252 domain-containing protein [Draconibacterium sp.]|nr:DUF4252 domain-containing protein [Draconibacterium sp.]
MKRFILLALVTVFWLPALAQNTDGFFKQLTDKYADKDGFSASMITSDMFDLYLKKKKVDEPSPVYEALKNLDKILVVSQSNFGAVLPTSTSDKKESKSDELYQTVSDHYKNGNYTLFKTEKRMGEDVKVYLLKSQEKINSIALITHSSASTNLIELQGDIDLATVAELNKALNLRGLENLYKINSSGNNTYFGYTTGVNTYMPQEKIEEMVARQRELFERQRALSDEQREKIEQQAKIQAEKQMEMSEKMRQMAERYQRQPILLNYPGDSTIYYINGKKVDAQTIKELDNDKITSIEVNKAVKKGEKTTVRFKTK